MLEAGWFTGQGLAIIFSFFNLLFIILNLASMMALMANTYFVIDFCLKSRVWKSNWKAVISSFIIWFSGTLIVVLFSTPLLHIDLGDIPFFFSATGRERQLTTGKCAEKTKHDFRCSICRSAIGQASCLICARRRQLTFPFCC